METGQIRPLTGRRSVLGEGPLWDAQRGALYYVDITEGLIHCYEPADGALSSLRLDAPVGCIVPDGCGGLVAAAGDALLRVGPGLEGVSEIMSLGLPDYLRFNDGKCDSRGRLWVGTMASDQSDPRAPRGGALYRLESGKPPVKVLDGMTIPNGLAWSRDETAFYHIDTAERCVRRYPYDAQSGAIGEGRAAVEIAEGEGGPDGMAMDTDGMLWVAQWDGSRVCRYNPADGRKIHEIAVPARYVSCCAFGGRDMDELFITTAMDEEGSGGAVYTVKPGARGTQPHPFRLSI